MAYQIACTMSEDTLRKVAIAMFVGTRTQFIDDDVLCDEMDNFRQNDPLETIEEAREALVADLKEVFGDAIKPEEYVILTDEFMCELIGICSEEYLQAVKDKEEDEYMEEGE